MRNCLLALFSPGRLCGTDRRLSSGSSSPTMAGAVRAFTLLTVGLLCATPLAAQSACPAIGLDSTCGFIITVTDAGTAISATGQPSYIAPTEGGDASVGTLVGVINNSSTPISSLALSSPLYIFRFITGLGIDYLPGVQGNASDTTGYGGPNAFFSNIDKAQQNGTVNFLTPSRRAEGPASFR